MQHFCKMESLCIKEGSTRIIHLLVYLSLQLVIFMLSSRSSTWSCDKYGVDIKWTESSELPQSSGRQAEMERRGDWLKARKAYKRSKQYIFVAATLPQAGKRTPGAVLKQKFPEASWVNGHLLHCHNPRFLAWPLVSDTQTLHTCLFYACV